MEVIMKNKFKKWMKDIENKSPNTAYQYACSIDRISKHYSDNTGESLDIYNETDLNLLRDIAKDYSLDGRYFDFGNYGNGTVRNAIATYVRFLESIEAEQELESFDEKDSLKNIHKLVYIINNDKSKKGNWTSYIIRFHETWKKQPKYNVLNFTEKYIWGKKVLIDPNEKIADVFNESIDKNIVEFFNMKNKSLIKEIEEEDLIKLMFQDNFKFIDFKRIINKLFIESEKEENFEIAEDETIHLANKSINNIKNELNTFKDIIDYYDSTIIQLNRTIGYRDEKISVQENTINNLKDELNESKESLKELEYIKEKLMEIKSLLEKV